MRSLPSGPGEPPSFGTWAPGRGNGGAALQGTIDACRLGSEPIASLARLAEIAREGRLAEVDGAFQLAQHEPHRLLLARDAIGHRTLFYAPKSPAGFAYASDVRTLLRESGMRPVLDPRAIAAYLSCAYVPGEGTLFQGVSELLPGHMAICDERGHRLERFFSLPPEREEEAASEEAERRAIDELRALLEETVRATLDPSEEAAASLSGGIDSSVVVALVQRALHRPLHTLSIAFGAEYKNELEWSSMVARHVQSDHTILHLTPEAIVSCLDETHALLASPIGDPLTVPNAILFRKAREFARCLWNGEGGDPCFGGPKNLPMVLAELYGDGQNDEGTSSPRARSYYRAHLKCFDELPSLLTERALAVLADHPLEREVDPYFEGDRSFVGALSEINVVWKGGHHILPKVDQLSRAAGVMPRSPLFSKNVVELAARLPPSLKLRGSVEKYALKEAVRDILPAAIIDRPKSGMMVPVEGWFQGPLLRHARERLLGGALPWDILRKSAVEALVDGRIGGLRPRRGVKIWLLVALESYLRQFS
ncbi:MAG: asparagine synthase [Deltaproteobacteria bacterium]|nr:asparagine synthase [Deltaproteobacteria bacterium]